MSEVNNRPSATPTPVSTPAWLETKMAAAKVETAKTPAQITEAKTKALVSEQNTFNNLSNQLKQLEQSNQTLSKNHSASELPATTASKLSDVQAQIQSTRQQMQVTSVKIKRLRDDLGLKEARPLPAPPTSSSLQRSLNNLPQQGALRGKRESPVQAPPVPPRPSTPASLQRSINNLPQQGALRGKMESPFSQAEVDAMGPPPAPPVPENTDPLPGPGPTPPPREAPLSQPPHHFALRRGSDAGMSEAMPRGLNISPLGSKSAEVGGAARSIGSPLMAASTSSAARPNRFNRLSKNLTDTASNFMQRIRSGKAEKGEAMARTSQTSDNPAKVASDEKKRETLLDFVSNTQNVGKLLVLNDRGDLEAIPIKDAKPKQMKEALETIVKFMEEKADKNDFSLGQFTNSSGGTENAAMTLLNGKLERRYENVLTPKIQDRLSLIDAKASASGPVEIWGKFLDFIKEQRGDLSEYSDIIADGANGKFTVAEALTDKKSENFIKSMSTIESMLENPKNAKALLNDYFKSSELGEAEIAKNFADNPTFQSQVNLLLKDNQTRLSSIMMGVELMINKKMGDSGVTERSEQKAIREELMNISPLDPDKLKSFFADPNSYIASKRAELA